MTIIKHDAWIRTPVRRTRRAEALRLSPDIGRPKERTTVCPTTGVKLRGPERSEGHVSFNSRVRPASYPRAGPLDSLYVPTMRAPSKKAAISLAAASNTLEFSALGNTCGSVENR
jgi:hypothetical protein